MPSLITTITPTYNRSDYLHQALQSIVAQTYRPIQAIVVDDGSTESIEPVVREVLDGVDGIQWIYLRQENAGAGAARNRGLEAADGEFVAFLDSDDLWTSHALDALYKGFVKHPEIDIVVGGWSMFINNEDIKNLRFFDPRGLQPSVNKNFLRQLFFYNLFPIHATLTKRSVLLNVQGFDKELDAWEDWDLWLRLASGGSKVFFVEGGVACWRTYKGDRRSNTKSQQLEIVMYKVFDRLIADPHLDHLIGDLKSHIYLWQILRRAKASALIKDDEETIYWLKRVKPLIDNAPYHPEMYLKYYELLDGFTEAQTLRATIKKQIPKSLTRDWEANQLKRSIVFSYRTKQWLKVIIFASKLVFQFPDWILYRGFRRIIYQ